MEKNNEEIANAMPVREENIKNPMFPGGRNPMNMNQGVAETVSMSKNEADNLKLYATLGQIYAQIETLENQKMQIIQKINQGVPKVP
jgi:hypothetical protein